MNDVANKKSGQWVIFIAVILVLFGIYGLARTCINMIAFEKYPQEGVYPPFPFFQSSMVPAPYYGGREEDCEANYAYYPSYPAPMPPSYPMAPVYDGYGNPGPVQTPTAEELKAQEKLQKDQLEIQKQNCISGIKEAREKAKVNDLSQSVLFLFLGTGVFLARKIFKLDR